MQDKIPDIQSTLDMVQFLQTRKVRDRGRLARKKKKKKRKNKREMRSFTGKEPWTNPIFTKARICTSRDDV